MISTKKDLYSVTNFNIILDLYNYFMSIVDTYCVIDNNNFNDSRLLFMSAYFNNNLSLCIAILAIYYDMFNSNFDNDNSE